MEDVHVEAIFVADYEVKDAEIAELEKAFYPFSGQLGWVFQHVQPGVR